MAKSSYNHEMFEKAGKLLLNAYNSLGSCGTQAKNEHVKMDLVMKKISQCIRDLDEIADTEKTELNYWNTTTLNPRGFERSTYEFYFGCVIVKYGYTYSVYNGSNLIVETDLINAARFIAEQSAMDGAKIGTLKTIAR